ncbi:MAG TPA: ABC transporter permease subunit [Vicinamibacterales bacterium]|nr:ABC transporter permease subunit [Vicinamibacterales bacterium]
MLTAALVVARKEVRDHLRDTRSLVSALCYALMGPFVIMLLSFSAQSGLRARASAAIGMTSVFALVAAFVGGMNVAMDTLAGERERRSLVPLFTTGISRRDIALGKWLAISVFALGGLALNLVAFGLVLPTSPLTALGVGGVATAAIGLVIGLAPLAAFAAAVELWISTACRSTKEAQTYLSLLVFFPMMIGMFLAFFPGWMDGWRFFVPLIGQYALIEGGLRGEPLGPLAALILGLATTLAAAAAMSGASRMLAHDDVVRAGH